MGDLQCGHSKENDQESVRVSVLNLDRHIVSPFRHIVWLQGLPRPMRKNAPNRTLGRFCALSASIHVEIRLHLGRDKPAEKSGRLPVEQVLNSLVLRRYFLFRERQLHLFLFVLLDHLAETDSDRSALIPTQAVLRLQYRQRAE